MKPAPLTRRRRGVAAEQDRRRWSHGPVAVVALACMCAGTGSTAAPAGGALAPPRALVMTATDSARDDPSGRPSTTSLGANLPAISDYSATPVFVDVFRHARRYGSPDAPWDEAARLDDDGWPIGDFGVVLMTGQSTVSGIAGTYRLTFTGQASVAVVASPATLANASYDRRRNRTRVDVIVPPGCDQLMLKFTQVRDGLKDLRLIRPGYDPENPPAFTRVFLAHVARFRVLRYMDWLQTNKAHAIVRWEDRPAPARTRHASALGTPWEDVVALANALRNDVWINVPVRADDEYIAQLARLLKNGLHPGARVYVEYSNELWNGSFGQHAINRELAIAEVRADPASPLAYDGSRNPDVWAVRRTAKRLLEIGKIFRAAFGESSIDPTGSARVRPVYSGQVVAPFLTERAMDFVAAAYGPPARHVHALASAPYFNLGSRQTIDGLSPDEVLAAMADSVERLGEVNAFEKNRALASWYRLGWLAYEGGADTFGSGSITAKAAASMDPRLRELCVRYMTAWSQAGGGMLVWYTAGAGRWNHPFGTWELTTDLARDDAPKIRCLDTIAASPLPAARARNRAPGTFSALASVDRPRPRAAAYLGHLHPGQHVDYLVHASAGGAYRLWLIAEAASAGNAVDIAINGAAPAGHVFAATGWGRAARGQPITVTLSAGFNTLRLTTRAETSGYRLHSLELEAKR